MVAAYWLSSSLPAFNIGIRLAPLLPNSSIASAVFSAPSGSLENLSATPSMISSRLRILPRASRVATPILASASDVADAGSTMPRARRPIALPTSSIVLPLSSAAAPNRLRLSTATPVRMLRSLRLSAVSIAPLASAVTPAIAAAGTNAPRPLNPENALLAALACVAVLPSALFRPLISFSPVTLALIVKAVVMSRAMAISRARSRSQPL